MSPVPLPEELKPGKVSSDFPLAGGDTLFVNGSWVVSSTEGERMLQLVPFDDLKGKRMRLLVMSSDQTNSAPLLGGQNFPATMAWQTP